MSTATLTPIGWVNEAGILFPLASYKPEHANHLDDHKKGWQHVYGQATVDQLQAEVAELREELGLTSPGYFTNDTYRALLDATKFRTGMPDLPTSTPEGSHTGPALLKPLCNCPALAWEDCEHTRGTKP